MFRSLVTRTVLPLLLAAGVVAYFGLPYIDRLLTEWFRSDVELRARVLMSSLEESLPALVARSDQQGLRKYTAKVLADQRVLGILICLPHGGTVFKTEFMPATVSCETTEAIGDGQSIVRRAPLGSVLVSMFDQKPSGQTPYRVAILYDLRFVDSRQSTARDYMLAFGGISLVILALFLVLAAWLVVRRWAKILIGDITGRRFFDNAKSGPLSLPILRQVRKVLSEMEETQRLEIDYRENWTPQALQLVVRDLLHSPQMIVVSNREPYAHEFSDTGAIEVQVPASGMVTALEPVMRACSGTWVAHGSGSADRAVVDAGSKTLSSDPLRPRVAGFGFVLGRRSRIARLSEEHGVIDLSACKEQPAVGDIVHVVPNHCCVVTNMVDEVYGVRNGRVEVVWPVAARGRSHLPARSSSPDRATSAKIVAAKAACREWRLWRCAFRQVRTPDRASAWRGEAMRE